MKRQDREMARYLLEGKSQTEAYQLAYRPKAGLSKQALYSRAARVVGREDFRQYMRELEGRVGEREAFTAARRREFVVRKLMEEAGNMDNPAAARIRALELVGKMHDVRLFTDAVDAAEAVRAPGQVARELRERLQRLAGAGEGVLLSSKIKDITPKDPSDEI